ncbi:recombinase family protein [Sinorhizobium meliloti]|uniref:recombinase family protein n=1 Tax=Rhizobium meliloti TaxID=382 RepID=UPI000FD8ED04|nr:recombinase family protein [Sinorhizobium meliloti]MDX1112934.1 helix-turn-helix domain-containing protein [Sinorhizobium medicae]MDX0283607.1 helix-turn-helix domain-containing protein [Sinorhizobium meliloti]RVH78046.1 recombinase family protein [Sinorhizobium meliloti]RVK71627.1 recombinase family protein [Sinorhizobium meliloti]RVL30202.1 recombinase family protein [Sinorhizobium meliloti]
MIIGYARVSSTGQDHTTQIERLKAAGAEKVFEEKLSGLDRERPELARALEFAREGDVLVVTKLDRLARSAAHLHEITETLDRKGVGFKVLDDASLDTTTRTGKLVFGILASIAEFETALRKERQMEGIARAKAEGRTGGRPKTVDEDHIRELKAGGMSVPQIVKETGVSRAAVYKALSA